MPSTEVLERFIARVESNAHAEAIEEFYTDRFARFIEKLDTMKDTDGKSVLDNSLIVYGSGHSDGNRRAYELCRRVAELERTLNAPPHPAWAAPMTGAPSALCP